MGGEDISLEACCSILHGCLEPTVCESDGSSPLFSLALKRVRNAYAITERAFSLRERGVEDDLARLFRLSISKPDTYPLLLLCQTLANAAVSSETSAVQLWSRIYPQDLISVVESHRGITQGTRGHADMPVIAPDQRYPIRPRERDPGRSELLRPDGVQETQRGGQVPDSFQRRTLTGVWPSVGTSFIG